MRDESTLVHCEHISSRSFDEVVAAFEAAIGPGDAESFRQAVKGAAETHDFEARMRAMEGSSGFMLFMKADHGTWMALTGLKARAVLYVVSNPLIARTMIQHDVGVGLNVPVRIMIYEDAENGQARIAYDLPSSLMARLKNERVTAAALELDKKLSALAETAAGAKA